MPRRAVLRLRDMKESIVRIRKLLGGKSAGDLASDDVTRAAFERFLEILSEASRHVPDDWKREASSNVPWRAVSDIGNVLRHAYHHSNAQVLWSIYERDLEALDAAVEAMLAAHGKED